jgi:hypothetical protein
VESSKRRKYSPHTPQPTLPRKQVAWGQLCFDFKFNADIAKADSNKAKADNNNIANIAVASNVAIEANKANEANNFDKADVTNNKADRADKAVKVNEIN